MVLLRNGWLLLVLAGCGSSSTSTRAVEVIDLDKVLEIWEQVTKTPIEGVTAEAEPGAELDGNAEENSRAMTKLLAVFENRLNEAKLIKGTVGTRLKGDGAVQGYRDADKSGTWDPTTGDKELFVIQIDAERERIIATSTVYEDTYHRDRYYRRHHHGIGGILFYSWMLGRQNRYYNDPLRSRPRFGAMSMAPDNYHSSAVSKARTRAGRSSRSRGWGSSSGSARSRRGSGSFSFGK